MIGRRNFTGCFFTLLVVLASCMVHGAEDRSIAVGRFSTLTPGAMLPGWKPMTFEKIDAHTRYALVGDQGRTVLQADADASASGLIKAVTIDPRMFPHLTWEWKVGNTLVKGDVTRKTGDDYAARIYVTFGTDSSRPSFWQRTKAAAIKLLVGELPPSAALAYVWGNQAQVGSFHPNAYTDRCQMIVVESGPTHLNQWRGAQRNVLLDYRRAFGSDPHLISGVAVMTDTDNTGSSAIAWYGDIVFRQKPIDANLKRHHRNPLRPDIGGD
jgi:hypothetical protein